MITLQMLLTALEGHVGRCLGDANRICSASGVLLLSPEEQPDARYIYAAEPAAAAEVLERLRPEDRPVLFLAGDLPGLEALCSRSRAVVCTTDLDFARLHNRLFRQLELYRSWQEKLALSGARSVEALLQNGSKLAEASVYLLDSYFQVITGSARPQFAETFRTVIDYEQSVSEAYMDSLFSQLENGFAAVALEEGVRLCAAEVRKGDYLLGYLLLASREEENLLRQMILQLALTAAELLSGSDGWRHGHISFQTLAQDLLSAQESGLEDLQLRLQQLPNPPKKYMRAILVRPEAGQDCNLGRLAVEAERIFPGDNVAVLGEEIFILVSSDYSTCPLGCTPEALEELLARRNCHAMVSNPGKVIRSLRILYHQCRSVFDVALKVQYHSSGRCLYFERFSQYYIIDLCAKQAKDAFGTDDIVFLCHPGVLALTRYDRTNHSDLRDVMFSYLMNRCSISRTAQELFMHRNTVIYKINKIEEILGQTMDDPYLRHSLAFSCMLIRYRENYQGENIRLANFERTTP